MPNVKEVIFGKAVAFNVPLLFAASFCSAWRLHGLSLKVSGGERETRVVQLCHVQKSRNGDLHSQHSPLLTAWEEQPCCLQWQPKESGSEVGEYGWNLRETLPHPARRIVIKRTKESKLFFWLFYTLKAKPSLAFASCYKPTIWDKCHLHKITLSYHTNCHFYNQQNSHFDNNVSEASLNLLIKRSTWEFWRKNSNIWK